MWPKRMSLQAFRESGFVEGSSPDIATLKTRVKKGIIPGEIHGNRYYVWVGPNNELMPPAPTSTDDLVVDLLMDEWKHEHGTAA